MRQLIGERRTRIGAIAAALVMLAAVVLMAGTSRGATDTTAAQGYVPNSNCQMTLIKGANFNTCVGPVMRISGSMPGDPNVNDIAGLIQFNLGSTTSFTYCIQETQILRTGASELMTESPWSISNVPNLPNIKRILDQHPAADTVALASTNPTAANREAAAVQAAIYHFSDAFDLKGARTLDNQTDDTAAVLALYNSIVSDAQANPRTEPTTSLTIAPTTATAQAGQEAGPFVVTTTATSPLSLAVSGGSAEVRDCTTHAVKTTAVNGDKLCVFSSSAGGPITLKASGTVPVDAGRVFINQANKSQEIILAGTKDVAVDASVEATFTAAATTTTTAPSTTTTTAPGSTTTTVAPTTTSTTAPSTTSTSVGVTVLAEQPQQAGVPVQPQTPAATPAANNQSSLPFTGANAATIAALAFALLSLGTFVVGMTLPVRQPARRNRR